jgi:hypothetical protein
MQSFLRTGFSLLVLRLIVLAFIWFKTLAVIEGHPLLLSYSNLGRALGPGHTIQTQEPVNLTVTRCKRAKVQSCEISFTIFHIL